MDVSSSTAIISSIQLRLEARLWTALMNNLPTFPFPALAGYRHYVTQTCNIVVERFKPVFTL